MASFANAAQNNASEPRCWMRDSFRREVRRSNARWPLLMGRREWWKRIATVSWVAYGVCAQRVRFQVNAGGGNQTCDKSAKCQNRTLRRVEKIRLAHPRASAENSLPCSVVSAPQMSGGGLAMGKLLSTHSSRYIATTPKGRRRGIESPCEPAFWLEHMSDWARWLPAGGPSDLSTVG